jgi:hypothetical protein
MASRTIIDASVGGDLSSSLRSKLKIHLKILFF